MQVAQIVAELDAEWSLETGFLGHLRGGQFVEAELARLLSTLGKLQFAELGEDVPIRAVSLLWYIPLFMGWQTDWIVENGTYPAIYGRAVDRVTNEIERILGLP